MKVQAKDLIGPALDWAVGDIEFKRLADMGSPEKKWVLDQHNEGSHTDPYSTDWLFGGPIIESETLCLEYDKDWVYDPTSTDPDDEPDNGDRWMAWPTGEQTKMVYGPTPLIAAMRCYVASKFGEEVEEVEIPDELCGGIHGL